MKIVGLPSSVHCNQLKDLICKIFDKLTCNVVKYNLEDCNRLKGNVLLLSSPKSTTVSRY